MNSWPILNNKFSRVEFNNKYIKESLFTILNEYKDYTFAIRGSCLEENCPHPNADLDLFVIHKQVSFDYSILTELNLKLKFIGMYIDWHIFN